MSKRPSIPHTLVHRGIELVELSEIQTAETDVFEGEMFGAVVEAAVEAVVGVVVEAGGFEVRTVESEMAEVEIPEVPASVVQRRRLS